MHRAWIAGREKGYAAGLEYAEGRKAAADAFANFKQPLTPSEAEAAKDALKGLGDLFGFTPGKFDTDEHKPNKPTNK